MPIGKILKFTIHGKPRTQKNSKQIIPAKDGRRPMLADSAYVKAWRKSAVEQLEAQWVGRPKILCPLAAVVTSYTAKRQRPDCDNLLAGPFDALQTAEVIGNDYQIQDAVTLRRVDDSDPRVEFLLFDPGRLHVEIAGAPK